jgi:hypothetical protein
MLLRLNLLAGFVCLFLLALLGCGKDEPTTPATPAPITSVEGAYKVTSGTVTPGLLGATDLVGLASLYTQGNCLTEATLTFAATGSVTNSNPASCQTPNAQTLVTTLGIGNGGKWAYATATNTLTISYGTNQTRALTTRFSGQTMILTGTLTANPIDNTPGNYTYVLTLTRV